MNPANSEGQTPSPSPSVSEWEVDQLRQSQRQQLFLTHLALAGLVTVSICVGFVLYYQLRALGTQAFELGRNSQRLYEFVSMNETNSVPAQVAFIRAMQKFAEDDPEFAATLARFPKFELPPANPPQDEPPANQGDIE